MRSLHCLPALLFLALSACGGAPLDLTKPVGSWSMGTRAMALREGLRSPPTTPVERKRAEEQFLGSEAGKQALNAVMTGLRADLDLRGDGTFSLALGSVPWDPKAPRVLPSVNLRGTWTQTGTRIALVPTSRDGAPLQRDEASRMTFEFADGRLSSVPQGDPGPRFILARR